MFPCDLRDSNCFSATRANLLFPVSFLLSKSKWQKPHQTKITKKKQKNNTKKISLKETEFFFRFFTESSSFYCLLLRLICVSAAMANGHSPIIIECKLVVLERRRVAAETMSAAPRRTSVCSKWMWLNKFMNSPNRNWSSFRMDSNNVAIYYAHIHGYLRKQYPTLS